MAEDKKEEIIIDGKDVKITDAEPVRQTADLNSPIAAKVRRLEEEAVRKKELELIRSERIRVQQDYLNGMLENVTESLAATEKERRINDALEADVRKQVLSMHGISEDKYEGMERRNAAIFQGAEFALFFMSIILVIISAFLNGMFQDITLFLCFFTALEGTLLNQGRRPKAIQWILRIIYLILFPVMLAGFIYYLLIVTLENEQPAMQSIFYDVAAVVGVVVLVLGVFCYFIYDPYRKDKKQLRKAGKYLKNMGKAADKEVARSMKKAEKARIKEEKRQAKLDRKEEKRQAKEARKAAKKGTMETPIETVAEAAAENITAEASDAEATDEA